MAEAVVPHVLEGQLEDVPPANAAQVNLLGGPVGRAAQQQDLIVAVSREAPVATQPFPPGPALTTSMARKAAAIRTLSTMMRLTLRGRLCSTVLLKPGSVPWLSVPAGCTPWLSTHQDSARRPAPPPALTAVLHPVQRVVELVQVVVEEEEHGHLCADEA